MIAVIICIALILAFYIFLAKSAQMIWMLAPYAVASFCAFFWGPAIMFGTDFSPIWGTIWAIGVMPVVYVITKLPQLIIPYFLLIYTVIFYNIHFIHNIVVFVIMAMIVVFWGVVSAYGIFGDVFWDNAFSNNIIVKIVSRIISTVMYWYSILVLECLYIISIKIDRTSDLYKAWKYYHAEIAELDRIKGLPYLWVSFVIAGIIGIGGLIIDLTNSKMNVEFMSRFTKIVQRFRKR